MNNNNSRIIAILLFLGAIIFAAWMFFDIVVYIFIAFVLTILGTPLVNLLMKIKYKKFKFPKTLAVLITMGVMFSLIYLFVRFFVPLVFSEIQNVLDIDPTMITDKLTNKVDEYTVIMQESGYLLQAEYLEKLATDNIKQILESFKISSLFGNVFNFITALVIGLFSVLFMTFFSLKDNQIFFKLIQKIIPTAYRENFANIVQATKKQLAKYLTGVFIEMIFVGVLEGVICWLLGVPNALLIGFFGGLLNIIPYVGPLIAAVLGLFFAVAGVPPELIEGNLIITLVIKVLSAFAVVKLLDDFLLQPVIYGRSAHAHPLEIFIVILVAGHIGGVLGMIFAVPAYSLLRIIVKEFFSQYYTAKV